MLLRSQNKLRRELWFINAGILSNSMYNQALDLLASSTSEIGQLNATLFLAIDYLIQYFELASINSTKLVNESIKRHLQFVEKFISQFHYENRYLPKKYWDIIFFTFDKFSSVDDIVEKQFSIDAVERICSFLTKRTLYWMKTSDTFSYLKVFGRTFKNCVVYNSFLIPKSAKYMEPLTSSNQKIFEKIEVECYCKISLDVDSCDCRIGPDHMVLEVLFDWYKGNFVGFLDCLLYVVKIINPRKYFFKSLRTITRSDSMYFSILSDLPLKELRGIEKNCRAGELIAPFLDSSVISKKIFNLLQPKKEDLVAFDKIVEENEDVAFWKEILSELDFNKYQDLAKTFMSDHNCWLLMLRSWKEFKNSYVAPVKPKYQIDSNSQLKGSTSQTDTTSEVVTKDNVEENCDEKAEENDGDLVIEINEDKEENITKNDDDVSVEINESNVNPITISTKDLKPYSNMSLSKEDNLHNFFEMCYQRISANIDTPYNCLNHTLRVILHCDTEMDADDLEIRKLIMPPSTIYDLLKKFYNYDLKKQTFYTREQRKVSFFQRQSLVRKQKEEMERLQYLESRRLVSVEIEKANQNVEDPPPVVESLSKEEESSVETTEDETPPVYEKMVVNDDILFADFREKKQDFSPEFKKLLHELFGDLSSDVLQMFNEDRINSLEIWHQRIKNNKETFANIFPIKHKPMRCNAIDAFQRQINPDQVEMIHSSVNTSVFVCLKLLSGHDPALDKEFPKAIKGEGITINFLTDINKTSGNIPKFISLVDPKEATYRKELNHNLTVVSFDIYLICASLSSLVGVLFDHHCKTLLEVIEKAKEPVKTLFKLFEFADKLEEARSLFKLRLHNRTTDEINTIFKLSQDLRRFHDFIFHDCGCNWRNERCIRIIYASVCIDGNRKCQEPFNRKGGDRRLKKIETKNNCMITMKLITHPTTGVQIPFVEIFYDIFKGNHFCTMDMLKKMFAENRGATARFVNTKHLLCLPYGELWMMPDLEWLKTKVSHLIAQEFTM